MVFYLKYDPFMYIHYLMYLLFFVVEIQFTYTMTKSVTRRNLIMHSNMIPYTVMHRKLCAWTKLTYKHNYKSLTLQENWHINTIMDIVPCIEQSNECLSPAMFATCGICLPLVAASQVGHCVSCQWLMLLGAVLLMKLLLLGVMFILARISIISNQPLVYTSLQGICQTCQTYTEMLQLQQHEVYYGR